MNADDIQRLTKVDGDKYRAAAKRRWEDDGVLEVDDDAKVSHLDDNEGAYVQVWVWVSNEDAGIVSADDDGPT